MALHDEDPQATSMMDLNSAAEHEESRKVKDIIVEPSKTTSDDEYDAPSLHRRYVNFIRHTIRGNPTESPDEMRPPTMAHQLMGEFIGTGIICSIGLGVNVAATAIGAYAGLFPVGALWGITVALAVLVSISVSGAHLNPAISFGFAVLRPEMFPIWKLGPYIVAQMAGGIIGAYVIYGIFENMIIAKENMDGIIRGQPGSELTASTLNCYFPNPGFISDSTGWTTNTVTVGGAFGIEMFCTGFLFFVVVAVTDPRHQLRIGGASIAFCIGLTITCLVSVFAPIAQVSINPARDFGPRIVAYSMGWDEISIPGPHNGMWVYLVAPFIGAPLGGLLHDFMMWGL
mmetsp:Transcript_17586/g.34586  ORF Transcript_17586/g.34586 Transcript_17586/m.34586 type:complete len:343 (+) Transcript_17586:158-1186(+)|eukprot:CAMPEP_0171492090 /NCGR_PEP_ID=MMETSP0958-20121227/4219_1 /TAXON_ID=87120 /ORGANISM="Aurantiochytrium limacinum, Strain ATCCMYA-1381" /LENGTH=342 /DNA_ID=CAMNT_0012025575 /DNA_START=117 /DNA_END=1145 /DNA_ORIENTATION=-